MKKILVYTLNESESSRRASVPPHNRKKPCAVWRTTDGVNYYRYDWHGNNSCKKIEQVNSWAARHGYEFYTAVEG